MGRRLGTLVLGQRAFTSVAFLGTEAKHLKDATSERKEGCTVPSSEGSTLRAGKAWEPDPEKGRPLLPSPSAVCVWVPLLSARLKLSGNPLTETKGALTNAVITSP